ncbi:MAG: hypothetical protein LBD47_11100 [Treponema sp.]|jgi:hypothetical protein|nr:hypothetical protein [Treponema sp.]
MFRFGSILALLCIFLSCARSGAESSAVPVRPGPRPVAVLQAGEYPLWFQLTDTGPALLDSIEDARFSAALIPWPLALHIRFILAGGDGLVMAVNRGGFMGLSPWDDGGDGGIGLYYVSGGEFWRRYTVGALLVFEEKPAALLYRDDRFLDSAASLPQPRTWTFSLESSVPVRLDIPALDPFPPEEGWDADTLRLAPDGFWYYRVLKQDEVQPEIRQLRTADLRRPGETVSIGTFQNSALPEPLSAAPAPLRELLDAAGGNAALVISPDFPQPRSFAGSGESGPGFLAYYRSGTADGAPALAAAVLPDGRGMYLSATAEPRPFSLPPLPDSFVYTGIGFAAGVLFAFWEEQEEFNIGAAGFMVIQMADLKNF